MKKKKGEKIQTVKGVIIPAEWDNEGDFTKVSLSAMDDEEYVIENSEKFIDMINQCISATGTIKRDKRSTKSIYIKKYSILDDLKSE